MKKKKFNKLFQAGMKTYYEKQYADCKVTEPLNCNDQLFTETNAETKNKITNLILRLLSHRDEINFNQNDRCINISKEVNISNGHSNKVCKSFYFSIEVIKGVGFILSLDSKRISMRHELLFDEIQPQIKTIFDEINNSNFSQLYSIIMKESGLARESNLDELFGEFL